jgi:hypothetical protein
MNDFLSSSERRRALPGLLAVLTGMALAASGALGCAADATGDQGLEQVAPFDDDGPDAGPGDGDDDGDGDGDGDDDGSCGDSHDDDCVSVYAGFGLVCTTCPGDAEPECLVASCAPMDACTTDDGQEAAVLQCMDPRGRIATDCSTEWMADSASIGFGGGDFLHSCGVGYGFAAGTTSACHYPGSDTCVLEDGCLSCTYQDGSGASICGEDVEDIDIFGGHPADLPPPGQCVTETVQDGRVECSTCTREDLSATISCRFAQSTCDYAECDEGQCIGCDLVGGGEALVCDPPVD